MKKVRGKWVLPVILVIILVFSYFSLYGHRTRYADIITTHIAGITGINGGRALDGTASITFYADEKVDAKTMDEALEIMKARLYLNYNISDCDIFADYDLGMINVKYAWDGTDSLNSPSQVASELGGIGNFYIRGGTSSTDTVLLDDSHLKEAKVLKSNGTAYVSYYFNDDGAEALKQATAKYKGSTISIWIDNVAKVRVSVTEIIDDGYFSIKSADTAEGSQAIVNTLSMKKLPVSFTAYDSSFEEASFGENGGLLMLIALIVFFIVIAVVLIAKFKMPGFAAAVSLLGYISFFVMNSSGTLSLMSRFNLSIPTVTAFALSVALLVLTMVWTLKSIKDKVNAGITSGAAFKTGSNESIKYIIYFNIGLLVLLGAIYGMFGFKPEFLPTLFTPLKFFLGLHGNIAVTEFASVLLFGILGNVIFGIIFFRLMLISVRGSKYFTTSVGGNSNEK